MMAPTFARIVLASMLAHHAFASANERVHATLRGGLNVVVAPDSHALVRLAAAEIRRYFEDMGVSSRPTISATLGGVTLTPGAEHVVMLTTVADVARLRIPLYVDSSNHASSTYYNIQTPREGLTALVGSDAQHVLYAAYSLLERMGCTFTSARPTIPLLPNFEPLRTGYTATDTPVFTTRGLQPFNDFAEGNDWWSEDELKRMIEAIVAMRGNLIAFHTYPLEEPAVWVGLNSSILPGGNVTAAYPTTWANTLAACCGGWGYNAVNTSDIGYGASEIFEHECFGNPVQSGDLNLCPGPKTDADAIELFNRAGLYWKSAFAHAKALGVQTVLGTEVPLSMPDVSGPIAPLQVWYSAARDDHFVTATNCAECEDLYVFLGTTGWIYNTYQAGTVPLFTDFNGKDNMLSASTKPLPGYSRVRQEGWAPGTANANTTLLLQYYNSVTGHHWAVDDAWVTNATAAGFGAVDILANVLSSGPPIASAYDFYVGTFQRLTALYGDTLSWYWSWTPEGWEWDNVNISNPLIQDAVKDSKMMQAAHDTVQPPFALASCGWVLGPLGARWYYDTQLPSTWAMSSIDEDVGNTDVDVAYANLTHRSTANKWAIPWAEDDPGLTAPELWVGRSIAHAHQAANYSVGGLLSIHWRTRATSPQIGSAHAVAWDLNLTMQVYWGTWAAGQFGNANAVAPRYAAAMIQYDSFSLPRPVQWTNGPGGLIADAGKCDFGTKYAWVDALVAMRPDMLAAIASGTATLDNLEAFDYWTGQFVYMRQLAVFQCDWAAYAAVIKGVQNISDPVQRQVAARTRGLPARVSLMTNATTLVQELLATVSTIEGSGTVYNIISHGMWGAIGPAPTSELVALIGEPLPANALPPTGFDPNRSPQARVQTVRTMLTPDEPFNMRAIVITSSAQPPTSVTLFTAPAGTSTWSTHPLTQAPAAGGRTRFVYTTQLPPAGPGGDFKWYLEARLPANTTAYTAGLGITAGTIIAPDSVTCYVPPGGAAAPQSVVIVPA